MNTKRIIIFLSIGIVSVAMMAVIGLPYTQLSIVEAQGYDTTPPELTTTPAQATFNVEVDATLTLDFSEEVTINPSGVTFTCDEAGAVGITVVSSSSTQVVLAPATSFPYNDACELAIPTANVQDLAGNPLVDNDNAEEDGVYQYVFTTESQPTIISVTPQNGAEDVMLNNDVTITVSEPLSVTGNPMLSFTCQPGGETISFTIAQDGDTTYVFNTTVDYPELSTCTLSFNAAALTADGDPLADTDGEDDGTFNLTFMTTSIPPEITATDPESGAEEVPVDTTITLTLNEIPTTVNALPILECDDNVGSRSYSTVVDANNLQVTLTPNEPLPFGNECGLGIDTTAILDSDGNQLVDNDGEADNVYVFNFFTEAAPQIIETTPTQDATGVSTEVDIVLVANEVLSLTGPVSPVLECGEVSLSYSLSLPTSTSYNFSPDAALPFDSICTLSFPVANIADSDGNTLLGNDESGDNFVLSFTTEDEILFAPAVEGAN